MSATVTVDDHADHTQKPPARSTEPTIAIEDTVAAGPSDADAVREATAALGQTQAQLTVARQTAHAAQTEAARSRDALARAAQGRVADQRMVLGQTIETADADLGRARTALRSAMDAGDSEAVAAATESISSANYRKIAAQGQLAGLPNPETTGDQTQRQPTQQTQPVWTPGPRARQWLADHPRMETDPEYATTAADADRQARRRGLAPETDGYHSYIDSIMDAAYGADHAGTRSNGGRTMANGRQDGGQSSSAGPSNRGGGGSQSSAYRSIATDLGVLEVSGDLNRGMRVKRPTGLMADHMDEGAAVCFPDEYAKNRPAAIDKYIQEQAKIAMEREAGGTGGMQPMGEGRTYR